MVDRIISGVIFAFGLAYLIGSYRIERFTLGNVLGAEVFPIGVGLVLVLLSAILFIQSRRVLITSPAERSSRGPTRSVSGTPGALVITGTLILYALTIASVGYILSTTVLLTGLMYLLGRRQWVLNFSISLAFSLTSYTIFVYGLNVMLPAGILPF